MRRLLASLVALLALLVSIELSAQETEPVEALPAVEDVPDAAPDAAAPVGVVPEDLATERMAPLDAATLEAAPAPLQPAATAVSVEAAVPLDADHELADFRCGDDALDAWLPTRALRNQADGSSRTWVVLDATVG